jgi:hypothetical protein
MKNLSPENVIIGMQNDLESLHAGKIFASELAPKYKASTVAERKFARSRQAGRRESHRRKAKPAQQEQGE